MLKTNTNRARKKNKIKVFNEEIKNSLGNSWGKRMYHISFFCKKGKPEKKKIDLSGGTGIKDFPGGTRGKEPTCQCKRQEMRVWSLGWENPLEEGMAAHSSVLAWRIPWTEKPGRSQRIRHDWSNLVCTGIKTLMIMEKNHSAMQIEFSLSLYSILIKSEKWSCSVVSDSLWSHGL